MQTYNLESLLNKAIDEGKQGFSQGLPFTIPLLNRTVGGILKSMFYLILGASKTGKSSFFYDQFIFNIADMIMRKEVKIEDVEIILYSLEINRTMIAAKAAVRYLFTQKKILTDTKRLLGMRGKPPDVIGNVMKDTRFLAYLRVINAITKIMTIAKPMEMYAYLNQLLINQSVPYGKDPMGNTLYHFKNQRKLVIVAIDHIALATEVPGMKMKGTIDLISKDIFVLLKRKFGITPVVIQQVNPSKDENGKNKVIYGHEDARDSKNTFQDCDIAIALGSPFHSNYESIKYKNNVYYVIPKPETNNMGLLDRLRMFGIEKDRYGGSSLRLASTFVGEVGLFKGIASPDEINYDDFNFNEYEKV